MSMHIDYAREVVEYHENTFDDHNLLILKSLASEDEVMAVAEGLGDEKVSSICKTMREAQGNRYKKVTDKQRYAVAKALLEKMGTARSVLAKAFDKTEAEMFGEPDAEVEGVQIHPTLRVAYGKLVDFVADEDDQKKGFAYPASRAAVRATKNGEGSVTVHLPQIGITAVSRSEFERLGLPEAEAHWYSRNATEKDSEVLAGKLQGRL